MLLAFLVVLYSVFLGRSQSPADCSLSGSFPATGHSC
jgi:hypothetical protein